MPTNGVATNGDVTPGAATYSEQTNGREFTDSQKELLRVIGQHLNSLGLQKTSAMLSAEAGCIVEHSFARSFRDHVLTGDWDAAQDDLESIKSDVKQKEDLPLMLSHLLEQKYLELLEKGDKVAALKCLRTQIGVLGVGDQRVHELSSFAMFSDAEMLHKKTGWPGVAGGSRNLLLAKIHDFLPSDVMLPQRRLETLLQQALDYQVEKCKFHNSVVTMRVSDPSISFVTDHQCARDDFPSTCRQVLRGHTDEVWYCTWSRDGKLLASCSKDGNVNIWKLNTDTLVLEKGRTLNGHRRGASFCAFSPDSKWLVVCGSNEPSEARLWSLSTGTSLATIRHNADDSYTTCSWFANSKKFVVASMRGHFALCNTEGNVLQTWDGVRVQSVAIPLTSTKYVLAADSLKRVRRYDFENEKAYEVVSEDYDIMSLALSRDERYALLNCANQGVHVWDLEHSCLVRKYRGLLQSTYTIYSTFGGVNEDYIASGSEDSKVYIWHRLESNPLCTLTGHMRGVNSVAWNPCYPSILVSASDDETLRVWRPRDKNSADEEEATYSSGGSNVRAADRLFSVEEVEGPLEED